MACWCTPTSLCQFSKSLALTKISSKSWVMWGQRIYEVAMDLGKSHVRLDNCFEKKIVNIQRWTLRFGCFIYILNSSNSSSITF